MYYFSINYIVLKKNQTSYKAKQINKSTKSFAAVKYIPVNIRKKFFTVRSFAGTTSPGTQ